MLKQSLALIGLTLSLSANAAIIDLGNITRDTDTGLDWLDMSYTDGMAYNSVVASISGGSLSGWSIASSDQVVELITNQLGYAPVDNWAISNAGVGSLVTLMGETYGFISIDETYGFIVGNTTDIQPSTTGNRPFTIQFGYNAERPGEGFYRHGSSSNPYDIGTSQAGTFMYREITAVPIPAAAWLFGSAMLGLIGVARRKRA